MYSTIEIFIFQTLAWPDIINSIAYLIKITEDMANATRLYGTLVEGKLNARKFYETNDVSYYTQEVKTSFSNTKFLLKIFFVLAFIDSE